MNHVDLFSGIGGFHLAGEMVWGDDFNTVAHVEIDPFCQKVLKKHWPNVPIISDIRDVTYERVMAHTKRKRSQRFKEGWIQPPWKSVQTTPNKGNKNAQAATTQTHPTIDLLTGGFPCQPFSCAGKQRSEKDDRYLWPEMLRVISEIRPTWIIGENVAGIINLALDQVLSDLENEGYTCQPFIIPACAQDAPHRRDRVWIVANDEIKANGGYQAGKSKGQIQQLGKCDFKADVANAENAGFQGTHRQCGISQKTGAEEYRSVFSGRGPGEQQRSIESRMGGMVNGLSSWLDEPDTPRVATGIKDRVNRLKSLGNAIVPQVVVPIMEAIKKQEDKSCFG